MKHEFNVNCLVGDILNFYTNLRLSNTYKQEKDPSEIIMEINLNDIREHTSSVLVTDGFINEFDYADVDPVSKEVIFKKKIKICRATYLIHVRYTKAALSYTGCRTYIYMTDLSKYDELFNQVPNDIYFW